MTKKYTSKDFNKQDEFNENQDDSFYDVSFDLPIDEDTDRHSSPKSESDSRDSTDKEKPSKWDGFYDEFKEKQEATFEQAKQEQDEIDEKLRQTLESKAKQGDTPLSSEDTQLDEAFIQQDAAKSSVMLDRSIRKVKSLFADFDSYEPPLSNPYKAEVNETLKQRSSRFKKDHVASTQANRDSQDEGLNSDSQEITPNWFKRFRHSTTDDKETLNETNQQIEPNERIVTKKQLVDDSPSTPASSDHSRSVTGVGLFKNLLKAPLEIDNEITFEKESLLDSVELDTFNKDTAVTTSTDSSILEETRETTQTAEAPPSSTDLVTDQNETSKSWYQRFSPFKGNNDDTTLSKASFSDTSNEASETATAGDEYQSFEDHSPLSKKETTDIKAAHVNKRVENELILDKDYFDSQKVMSEAEAVSQPIDTDNKPASTVSPAQKTIAKDDLENAPLIDHSASSFKQVTGRRRYSSDLPSPEEIRKERERRRRLRVQELEQMSSSEEVEQTYKQSYSEWLKDFNKNSTKKDTVQNDKDKELELASTPVISDLEPASFDQEQATLVTKPEAIDSLDDSGEPYRSSETFESTSSELTETVDLDKVTLPTNNSEELIDLSDETAPDESTFESGSSLENAIEVEASNNSQLEDSLKNASAFELSGEKQSDLDTFSVETDDVDIVEASEIPNLYGKEEDTDLVLTEETITDDEWSNTVSLANDNVADTESTNEDTMVGPAPFADGDLPLSLAGSLASQQTLTQENQAATVDLTEVNVVANDSDDTHFTVIHEPVNVSEIEEQVAAEVEANLLAESIPIYKRKDKETKKEIYSLAALSTKERIFFGMNIAFNVVKRIGLYIILISILGGAMAGGVGFGYFANLVSKTPPPSSEEMAAAINRLEQQSTLYYASGEPIANIRADVVRTITNIDEISPFIIDGLIATEDEDFYNHPGVMPKAIFRAVIESILTDDGSGGSTLTQQLVKQQLLSPDVTFFRKANEILLALRLENYFTKDQILMAYLNVSPFGRNNNGDNVAGIMKASEGIFGVKPNEVTLNQAAFLVGLPQDPYNYTPYDQLGALVDDHQAAINRMHEVLYRMYREKKITKEDYETAMAYDITQDFLPQETRDEQRQSYLYQSMMNGAIEQLMLLNIKEDGYDWKTIYEDVDWYNEYYFAAEEQLRTGGYKVYTTIDKEIYDQLQVSATAHDDQLGATYDGIFTDPETGAETYYIESVQTGIVVIDNKTGKVLGFVAGKDFENNQIDHAFNMRRSPGSTIKPLAVYGPAIEENLINPSTIIPDTAFVHISETGEEYRPTNYGEVISGTYYSARTALMKSDNIPTVRIYEQLLNRKVPIIDYLEKMGFNTVDSYTESSTQNLSFALGGVDTGPTVFEQTRAFSTFANNGQYVDGYYIERIEDTFGNVVFQQNEQPVQVFSEDSNYLMVDMLRDTMDGGSGQTAGGVKNFGGDWISKSGISENSKDIWFIGSTPNITIGSWIGYDNQYAEYVFDLNDGFDREAVRSQTYWGNIVNDLYALRPDIFGIDQSFTQPDSVQSQAVLQSTGTLPGSVQINNRTYQVTSPTYEDLFKKSNPAPALSFNFMFNATDNDHQTFWSQFAQKADQQRQQQQQQPSSSSSSSSEAAESSGDETSEAPPAESAPEETPPAETPPVETPPAE